MILMKVDVVQHRGRATLLVDDEPVSPMAFCCNSRNIGSREAKELTESGFRLFFLHVDSGWNDSEGFVRMTEEAAGLIAASPDVLFIIRVKLVPPDSWLDSNPNAALTFEDGRNNHFSSTRGSLNTHGTKKRVCIASKEFREEAGKKLQSFIKKVESSSFGNRTIGYFLTGPPPEWYVSGDYNSEIHGLGYSAGFKQFYSHFLKEKYGNEQNLQKAWGNESANFLNPDIPTLAERKYPMPLVTPQINPDAVRKVETRDDSASGFPFEERIIFKADFGSFLDPDKSAKLIDFYQAWNESVANTVEYLAKTVKKATDNKKLAGSFYGIYASTFVHHGGVAALKKLLDSPYIDFLSAPGLYEDRPPGGAGTCTYRAPVDAFYCRNKLWIHENDTRTWRSQPHSNRINYGGYESKEESLEVLKRDFAQNLCDDVYAWWFCMGKNEEKAFYFDKDVFNLFKKQNKIAADYYHKDRTKASEIAFVYDQDSVWPSDPETTRDLCMYSKLLELPRIGAPADHILIDDLDNPLIPQYKLYVFVNCFVLDNAKRKKIEKCVKCNGKTALWIYAPGLINPQKAPQQLNPDYVSELTGININCLNMRQEGTFRIYEHEMTKEMSPFRDYGRYNRPNQSGFSWAKGKMKVVRPAPLNPVFFADDPDCEILGEFINNGKAAWVIKRFDSWQSVWLGSKVMNAEVIRAVAENAGVHIFSKSNDVFAANRHFVSIHTSTEGQKTLHLPAGTTGICDIYSGERYLADANANVILDLDLGITRTFRCIN
jgi:hypothetical protein